VISGVGFDPRAGVCCFGRPSLSGTAGPLTYAADARHSAESETLELP
jgi:hypothetical protein